jgi:hypothetical protein
MVVPNTEPNFMRFFLSFQIELFRGGATAAQDEQPATTPLAPRNCDAGRATNNRAVRHNIAVNESFHLGQTNAAGDPTLA